ncbi:MAG: ribose 5-phosphate isomerase B [Bacteroidales bacterium]|nr:ribose 5-phosphate isomerase B [Bacteroidales bacterium]
MKSIGIASDHAGFELKEKLKLYLESRGYILVDFGSYSSESVDYPDFAHTLAYSVEKGECDIGITLCGSGNGISMAANKHEGIRSAICWKPEIAKVTRSHNNANICALPARFLDYDQAIEIVDIFLNTEFEGGGRHERRIKKIPIKK